MGDGAVRRGLSRNTQPCRHVEAPVVFMNNGYAMGTSVERSANHTEIWKLGLGYDIPCGPVEVWIPWQSKGQPKAVDRARKGEGPSLLESRPIATRDLHE